LSLTDQAIAFCGGDLTESSVNQMLGSIDQGKVVAIVSQLQQGNASELLKLIGELSEQGQDFAVALEDLLSLLHQVAICQVLPDAPVSVQFDKTKVLDLAQNISPADVQLFYQMGIMARKDLEAAPDLQAGFEMALLRMLAFRPQQHAGQMNTVMAQSQPHGLEPPVVMQPEPVFDPESELDPEPEPEPEPVQSGPLIDLLGTKLHSLEINADEQSARVKEHFTNEVLDGKKVIGLYFSADWCGPCRQFTPELVSFYDRMNKRRGQKDHFQIVMISRCRDVDSHYQYFSQMPWLAMPLDEAAGQRGQQLGEKYGVQGIPSLVLVDDLGQTITTDARSKIPADKAGIGFPWRNPLSQLYNTLVPRSLRMIVKLQVDTVRTKFVQKVKKLVGLRRK